MRDLVRAPAGLDVAQQKVEGQQKEESAQHLVVDRTPTHRRSQAGIDQPQNLRADSGRRPCHQTAHDTAQQQQARGLR